MAYDIFRHDMANYRRSVPSIESKVTDAFFLRPSWCMADWYILCPSTSCNLHCRGRVSVKEYIRDGTIKVSTYLDNYIESVIYLDISICFSASFA